MALPDPVEKSAHSVAQRIGFFGEDRRKVDAPDFQAKKGRSAEDIRTGKGAITARIGGKVLQPNQLLAAILKSSKKTDVSQLTEADVEGFLSTLKPGDVVNINGERFSIESDLTAYGVKEKYPMARLEPSEEKAVDAVTGILNKHGIEQIPETPEAWQSVFAEFGGADSFMGEVADSVGCSSEDAAKRLYSGLFKIDPDKAAAMWKGFMSSSNGITDAIKDALKTIADLLGSIRLSNPFGGPSFADKVNQGLDEMFPNRRK